MPAVCACASRTPHGEEHLKHLMVRSARSARLEPWAACTALARGPSFETRPSAAPQDEVEEYDGPHGEERASRTMGGGHRLVARPSAFAFRAKADKSRRRPHPEAAHP